MKTKNLKKKLTLNKATVSNLSKRDQQLVGGVSPLTDPACSFEVCPPPPTQEGKTCDTCPGVTCLLYGCVSNEDTSCWDTICQ